MYMKLNELNHLGINANEVYNELLLDQDLRELHGFCYELACFAYSEILGIVFRIEDVEPTYHSPLASLLKVYPILAEETPFGVVY